MAEEQVYLNVTTAPEDTEGPTVPLSGYQNDPVTSQNTADPLTNSGTHASDDEDKTVQPPLPEDNQADSPGELDKSNTPTQVTEPLRQAIPIEPESSEQPKQEDEHEHPHAHISISNKDPLEDDDDDELKSEERSPMPASYPEVNEREVMEEHNLVDPADNDEGLDTQDYPTFEPSKDELRKPATNIPEENITEEVAQEMADKVMDAAIEEEKHIEEESEEKAKEVLESINLDAQNQETEAHLNEKAIPAGASMSSVLSLIEEMQHTVSGMKESIEELESKISEARQKVV